MFESFSFTVVAETNVAAIVQIILTSEAILCSTS